MKVFLVHNEHLFRLGLKAALAGIEEVEIVGEAATARESFTQLAATHADLVLMDVNLPGMDGAIATRELKRRMPQVKVILVGPHLQAISVLDALRAGAVGFVLSSADAGAFLEAVRAAAEGNEYISPELRNALQGLRDRSDFSHPLQLLSEREREVFRMAVAGLANTEIARELCISIKTVETHRYRINKKLGFRSNVHLVRFAAQSGLLGLTTIPEVKAPAPITAVPTAEDGPGIDVSTP